MNYYFNDIANITNGKIFANDNPKIECLIYDSRMIIPTKNSLFFAIKTKYNDGHFFIKELYDKGHKNFIVNQYFKSFNKFKKANFIQVNNTVKALQKLATFHRNKFNIPVIGITGSNGKTIVKEWLTYFLNKYFFAVQSPKSFNSQIGVPLSVWEMNENHEIAVFEAGISKKAEMDNLQKIIMPDIGIFTNIGDAHQENFSSVEEKINEKIKLFYNSDIIIFSKDCYRVKKYIANKYPNKKFFTWSEKYKADLKIISINKNDYSTIIKVAYKEKKYSVKTNFTDRASIENIIITLSALLVIFPDKKPNSFDFTELSPVEMRLQQIKGKHNSTIINDAYNADITSLRIAIDVLNSQNQNSKKTLIISDIFQVGKKKNVLYAELSNILNKSNINRLIAVGKDVSKYKNLFSVKSYFFDNTKELISSLKDFNFDNEAVLIKGARKFKFEQISDILQLKNHRTVLEINLNALENNLYYFKNYLNKNTKIMAMVKAFSYGSGSYEIANFLKRKNVHYLAVAITDEGIELRKGGIDLPILILNPDSTNFNLLIKYNLEPEIYNFKILDEFYNAVKNKIYNPYPIHLKINTGMNRLGFCSEEINFLIKKLKNYPKIFVKSVFSHLAASDEPKYDNFTKMQINQYKKITKKIKNSLNYSFIKHILNSAGIERFPQAQFDMVRLGIGLYGVSATDNPKLQNISTLKTKIIHIAKVKKGETVGYGRKGKIEKDSIIATIPIGYADGLNRLLSNRKGKVLINNSYVPIIGNICMDLTMIDVSEVNAKIGDEVVVFGKKNTITKIANELNTIPYEILTSIPQRVKRVYLWE